MAVSIVNGYFCSSSCDVAKAKKGENPHPSTDPGNVTAETKNVRPGGWSDQPVVLFGGALSAPFQPDGLKAVDGAQPPDPARLWRQAFAVDVLA